MDEQLHCNEEARLTTAADETSSHSFADLALAARVVHSEIRGNGAEKTRQPCARRAAL